MNGTWTQTQCDRLGDPDPEIGDFSSLEKLNRQIARTGLWGKLAVVDKATLRVVQWILKKGDRHILKKIRRSPTVRRMLKSSMERAMHLLESTKRRLSFRTRATLEGMRMARGKIMIYREKGVLYWAPWVVKWLQDPETMFHLGSMSLSTPFLSQW